LLFLDFLGFQIQEGYCLWEINQYFS
jgi:hypothetical protein